MTEPTTYPDLSATTARRVAELFQKHRRVIFERTDRLFAGLLVCQWVFGIFIALVVSPRAWAGSVSGVHPHVWAALVLGGAIIGLPVTLGLKRPGERYTRHVIAVGQMLISSLLIHLTGGRIETHFHIFGSLAFLAFYRDWKVFIPATIVVGLDHYLRGVFWPQSVYGVLTAGGWRWLEHAGWVAFEDVFLIKSCIQSVAEMRNIAERQAQLEGTNQIVERAVRERTRELAASEERFRTLSVSSPIGILQLDEAGGCLYANERWQEISGLSAEESLGRGWIEAIHPEDRAAGRAAWESAKATRHELTLEFRVSPRGGEPRWVHLRGAELGGAEREHRGLVATVEDVTERRHAEDAIHASEERFKAFMDNSPAIAFVKNAQGGYEYVNQTFERLLGKPGEPSAGRQDTDRFSADVVSRLREHNRKVLETGQMVEAIETIPTNDGEPHEWSIYEFPITDAAGQRFVGGIAIDVTEKKQLEEQLRRSQRMEAVGRLAGGIAHDFNNLLTAITGYSQLLMRRLTPASEFHASVEEIYKAGQRAAELTRQLLAYSRKQVLQPKVINLNVTVTDTEKLLRRLIGEDIDLKTALDPELGRVKADPGQIGQVIINLVLNARDAMPEGGKLTIETACVELNGEATTSGEPIPAGSYVLLAVSDNGHGMDADTRGRIFEPFFTTKGLGKGTGLGLSTVQGIVHQSGGHIVVYSEVGFGTTFKVFLPRLDQTVAVESGITVTDAGPRGSEVVLLTEDEEGVRNLCRVVLEGQGYHVLEACHGEDAIEVAKRHSGAIDILLTDVVMPGMSGRQLADRLCRIQPSLKVLYMSGYTDDALGHRGVLEEGTEFIQKPFTPSALTARLREVLDRRRAA